MLKALQKRFFAKGRQEEEEELAALRESMRSTQGALERAYDGFNRAADGDLIESYVYEINALRHRYSYLLRQIRRLESAPACR